MNFGPAGPLNWVTAATSFACGLWLRGGSSLPDGGEGRPCAQEPPLGCPECEEGRWGPELVAGAAVCSLLAACGACSIAGRIVLCFRGGASVGVEARAVRREAESPASPLSDVSGSIAPYRHGSGTRRPRVAALEDW